MAVRPAGTHFSSVSRHRMTSVVFNRLSVFAFLTAWGVVFHRTTDPLDRFWLVQKDSFYLAVYSGLACRPADINLLVGFVCARETPILAGGIGVARFVAGAFFVLFLVVWAS